MGRRYVLFANADDWLCPAVGWGQGRYTVGIDEDTGREFPQDSHGHAVYRFARGVPVTKPRRKGDRPMTLAAFLKDVARLVKRQKPPVEATPKPAEPPADEQPAEDVPAPKADEIRKEDDR